MSGNSSKVERYLVRPRESVVGSIQSAARSLKPQDRSGRATAVRSARVSDNQRLQIRAMLQDHHAKIVHGGPQTAMTGVQVVDMSAADAERLRREQPGMMVLRDRRLELIRPVRTTSATASPSADSLWHLDAIGLTAAIRANRSLTGKGVRIAVLDTGVDASHPELGGRRIDAFRFNTTTWKATPQKTSTDTEGHGTHVAGLICGQKVGVAPGASVTSGITIPNGDGMLSDFVLALEWVANRDEIQIVNMSAGIPGWVDGMRDVVADLVALGIVMVVATGNEGPNRTRSPGNYVEGISVGASTRNGEVASFSSGGRLTSDAHVWTVPDLVAPGKGVTSCVVGGGYEAWDGTSMATPIVSGIAALLLEQHSSRLGVIDLQELLFESCRNLGAPAERQGRGLVSVNPSIIKKAPASTGKKKVAKAGKPHSSASRKRGSK